MKQQLSSTPKKSGRQDALPGAIHDYCHLGLPAPSGLPAVPRETPHEEAWLSPYHRDGPDPVPRAAVPAPDDQSRATSSGNFLTAGLEATPFDLGLRPFGSSGLPLPSLEAPRKCLGQCITLCSQINQTVVFSVRDMGHQEGTQSLGLELGSRCI